MTDRQPVTPSDLREAAAAAQKALAATPRGDWDKLAHGLTWTCEATIRHTIGALSFYASSLATRAPSRTMPIGGALPEATRDDLVGLIGTAAAVLADVATVAPSDARGFHPAGMADAEGFLSMGCTEILAHAWDVATAFGVELEPPDGAARHVLTRIFPWAPLDHAEWDTLLWATGRGDLPDLDRLGGNWSWQCAPLEEWDGTRRVRGR